MKIDEQDRDDIKRIVRASWFFLATLGRFIKNGRTNTLDADTKACGVAHRVDDALFGDLESSDRTKDKDLESQAKGEALFNDNG